MFRYLQGFYLILFWLSVNECRVTAVDGQYQIGIYTVRPIQYGEEITFDYNSVTEVRIYMLLLSLRRIHHNSTKPSF